MADAVADGEIIEVQTGSFYPLRKKLAVFLQECPVTVVFPIPTPKYVCRQDPRTGELSAPRKSLRPGSPYDLLVQVERLGELATHPELTFRAVQVELTEIRLQGEGRHRGPRLDRIPQSLRDDWALRCPADYARFLPAGLPEVFTVAEFAHLAHVPVKQAGACLRILRRMGVAAQEGKRGRILLYTQAPCQKD